ncbi:DUF3987 domain-containing protein [Enterococcus xiangfangensis]|uniref:Uncharacterized protein n=1 Tax=Enterococcus xiangfangensis TaxID=1296537 RepID=A0ABU3F9Z4_9ENTE|nr:DUF3987 domain-containing protein [Enterococcus xiangfangensis]MBM7711326.1 F0F1-type ATP synthase membrane subunit b/b' [Enterococcus xiangfangensis]MDT2759479.1 hypothetical protein [Enterococcus xiangfangensis]
MLEALEKIKFAEEQNEREKEKLIAELAAYEASRKKILQEKKAALKNTFSEVSTEKEKSLTQKLADEEQELTNSATAAIKLMEKNYLEKKEQTIQAIIERVISEYGS